jgi:hypothetical protein
VSLFDDPRRATLDAVIDRLNRRYGCTTVTIGTAYARHSISAMNAFRSGNR